MILIPHHTEHDLHRPTVDDENRWGAIPLLLGVVAIAVIGVLVLTNGF
jgi:hypothetical protein